MIQVGHIIPSVTLKDATSQPFKDNNTHTLFKQKKVLMFGLPGAFTPVCSSTQVPGYLKLLKEFQNHNIDFIACISVNDAYVMHAWAQSLGVGDSIVMLADGSCDLTQKMGLSLDLTSLGMGMRSQRYAMVLNDLKVDILNVEPQTKECTLSSAQDMLSQIRKC